MTENTKIDNKVVDLFKGKTPKSGFDNGGDGPHDGDMDARVKKLEEEMLTIKTDLGIIKANYATKADIAAMETSIHKELHNLTWKLIGVAGALVAAVYFVATHAK
ncbi:MAG: hypothetical protein GAK35_02630 [Herbaspirillum frisingense]|uniref:DUF1640 domain-containing protein n=1 Tax=Herbaspirillum frisingense TaxID=92645 RepID=A0A7V8FVU8_9BURK|nr:MAG: hypothetical protein GAK35_02630 [Herbaspirillum frisingense]